MPMFAEADASHGQSPAAEPQRPADRKPAAVLSALQAGAADGAAAAIVFQDAAGKITFWNAAATRSWEWTEEEAIGQPAAGLLFADQRHYEEITREVATAGKWRGHVMTRTKSGRLEIRYGMISPWNRGDDAGNGVLMSFRAPMFPGVDPAMMLRLERLEAVARGMASRTHDLKNAVSPFTMSLELLRPRLDKPEDGPLLQLVEEATARLCALAEDFLEDARHAISLLPKSPENPA
jgi:PAS domain S-box-containing protein